MKAWRKRAGGLALLVLCAGIITAEVAILPAAQFEGGSTPSISTNQYLGLLARRCNNLEALAQLLVDAQYTYLPILPPCPAFGFNATGSLTPFNFTSLPAGFDVNNLTVHEVHGVPVYPLTIAQDPATRETVFLNSLGDELYRLPAATGYDPVAWLLACWPGLAKSLSHASSTNNWLQQWDPARIQVSLKLIAMDDVVPYLQAAALAQSCRLGQQSLAFQQNGLTPMMLTASDPCAITNESDPFAVLTIQPDSNGWMTLTWESCTGRVYAVEARTDLLDGLGWVALASNAGEVGSTAWTDFDAPAYPQRFYRVQRQPLNYCSVSNCVLTNFDIEVPDWWKMQHGFPVSTPAGTVCSNGLTVKQNFNLNVDPNQPVLTPNCMTITGQFLRAVLGKCGFDEYTTNPVHVYLRQDQVGQQDSCGGLTNYTRTIIYYPTPTNFTVVTNESMAIEYDVNVFLTNSATQLIASNSNPAIEDNYTNTLSELYTTENLTNLAMAALTNGMWTVVSDSSQCAAIRALTPGEKTNLLQKLEYCITFQSQSGFAYNVKWAVHTEYTNGFITNSFLSELVAGNGSTASTTNHLLDLPSLYGTSTVTLVSALLVEAGKYIVPGSTNNAIRYAWTSTNVAPNSVRMEIYDKATNLVRTITNLPTSCLATNAWAEQKWNGMQDDAGTLPLTETNSPYTLKVIGTWGSIESSDATNAYVESWLLDLCIGDKPGGGETLVTGADEEAVTPSNLVVNIALDGNTNIPALFAVSNNTEVAGGPVSNQWGCCVTPTNYLFYTTPQTPYDIRYLVTITAKTSTNSATAGDGLEVQTITDGTLNLWDMDTATGDRQTNAVWQFGIGSTGAPPAAVLRNLQEIYQ